jgi:hypothetical protein
LVAAVAADVLVVAVVLVDIEVLLKILEMPRILLL